MRRKCVGRAGLTSHSKGVIRDLILAAAIASCPSVFLVFKAHAQNLQSRNQGLIAPAAASVVNQAAAQAASQGLSQGAIAALQRQMSLQQRNQQAIGAIAARQDAARRAAASANSIGVLNGKLFPPVPDGLGAGGLQLSNGPDALVNANAPTQSSPNGQTNVVIGQTASKALLNWQTFNVGSHTTLTFDQQGNANWVALNRVLDPSGVPSQILGRIKADGQIYVINRNGIIFGGASQINVQTLLASSLDLFSSDKTASNNRFLNGGIGDLSTANGATNAILLTSSAPGAGDVTAGSGARIETGDLGLALIAAPNVTNGGTITAPDGQIALIAGAGVAYDYNTRTAQIQTNGGYAVAFPNATSTNLLRFYGYERITGGGGNDITPRGILQNNGILEADRGNVTLIGGGAIQQNGAALVTTSATRAGSIVISSQYEGANPGTITSTGVQVDTSYDGPISFGPGSVTAVGLDANSQAVPNDAASLAPFRNQPAQGGSPLSTSGLLLPARGLGEISVTGQAVDIQGGAQLYAPGQSISINTAYLPDPRIGPVPGAGRVFVESGATLDVSGVPDVQLPVSSNFLTVTLAGNELADSPLQRADVLGLPNGAPSASAGLQGLTITVDTRVTGTNPVTGQSWVGTPLANLASYSDLRKSPIGQVLVNGGAIGINAAEIDLAPGSALNLSGGFIHYIGETVQTTRLADTQGRVIDVSQADPNDSYTGYAGLFTLDHAKWNIKDRYSSPLLSSVHYEPDYIQGGNGGTLSLMASKVNNASLAGGGSLIFGGTVNAQALAGERQIAAGTLPMGGSLFVASPLPVEIGTPGALSSSSLAALSLPSGFTMASPLLTNLPPDPASGINPYAKTVLSDASLSDPKFSNITIGSSPPFPNGSVTVDAGATVTVQPGGSISITGTSATLDGSLIAHAGSVTVETTPMLGAPFGGNPSGRIVSGNNDIGVGSKALIDVSGLFVNDSFLSAAPFTGPANLNGGSISFLADTAVSAPSPADTNAGIVFAPHDYTGNIVLAAGSRLDLSGGGRVLPSGLLQTKNGLPVGAGGNLTLSAYNTSSRPPLPLGARDEARGQLILNGSIDALGFNGAGSLTLHTLALQIGGDRAATPAHTFNFDPNFWGGLGFGAFNLNAELQATVPAGAQIQLIHRNLVLDGNGGYPSTGGLPGSFAPAGILPVSRRSPTNLSISAGLEETSVLGSAQDLSNSLLIGKGADIFADPLAKIALTSSSATDIYGRIHAPGGSITASALYIPSNQQPFYPVGALYLAPGSLVDVSGTSIIDPFAAQVQTASESVTPRTGTIVPGGTVTLQANFMPILVDPGATIDVSGAADTFQVLQPLASGTAVLNRPNILTPEPVWSDAGRVNLNPDNGLIFEGRLIGNPGSSQGKAETLAVAPLSGDLNNGIFSANITLVQNLPNALRLAGATFNISTYDPAHDLHLVSDRSSIDPKLPSGLIPFGVDSLDNSGFGSLIIDASASGRRIDFSGKVNLTLGDSLISRSSLYTASASGDLTFNPSNGGVNAPTNGASLTVTAPYIGFGGVDGMVPVTGNPPFPGDGVVNLSATKLLDISSSVYLENIGQANFTSAGDLRFLSTGGTGTTTSRQFGGFLYTTGNLAFNAAQVYPVTNTLYVIEAGGSRSPATTISFGYPSGVGPSTATPLSANGTLLVDATNIVQNGDIHVPFGSIILGSNTSDLSNVLGSDLAKGAYPGVVTQSVTLGAGSVTSVSAKGAVIPYGSTVDQTQWVYNPSSSNISNISFLNSPLYTTPLAAPPTGSVTVTSPTIALNSGALIDLSGGGDLQAQEWIPGTGGSRDVLSQVNLTFPSGASAPVQTSLYNDKRQVFAILPGYGGNAATFDATLAQSGGLTPLQGTGLTVGKSVYLSGGPGLAAGTYTLLPGRYATLPGAFRVVQNTGYSAQFSTPTVALPDGTLEVSGYLTDGFTGAHSSTPQQFYVQSGPVWKQYSEYALSSANTFFPAYAAQQNIAVPLLPRDSARLVLAATAGLTLNATLASAPAAGGRGAAVDITSQFIEITGSSGAPLQPGYLGISAASLDALGAGSLLTGGTRSQTTAGTQILPFANGIIVANDASTPLEAPEILLAAAPQLQQSYVPAIGATVSTPVPGTGQIVVRSGAVIEAQGDIAPGSSAFYRLGPDLTGVSLTPPTSSNVTAYYNTVSKSLGSLLRLSQGSPAAVQVADQSLLNPADFPSLAPPNGTSIIVNSGATLLGGNALTLAGTGDTQIQSGVTLGGRTIQADSSHITFLSGQGGSTASGFVIDSGTRVQLLNAQNVVLRSHGTIDFQGNIALVLNGAGSSGSLTLSGSALTSDGGNVLLGAPRFILDNELGAPAANFASGSGSLSIEAGTIVFGAGNKTVSGFGSVNAAASRGILGQGTGVTDFGSLPVTFQTPVAVADTGSDQTIQTGAALSIAPLAGTPFDAGAVIGGALTLRGGSVRVAVPVLAPGGNITLNAASGDVVLASGGSLSSRGVAKQFFDVTKYADGGAIALSVNNGTVILQQGSSVDFSGASGSGGGGSLTIATANTAVPVTLAGTLSGGVAPGSAGSSFSLDAGGAVALDPLAQLLTQGNVTGRIAVHSAAGDLALSGTLAAKTVALTADGGLVNVSGKIDASGAAGGQIDLYGANGVTVTGSLLARGSDANQRGGTVNLGTIGVSDGTLNASGSLHIVSSGAITIAPGAVVDVSGGTFAGLSGGALNIRAPILDVAQNGVPAGGVAVSLGGSITGARDTMLEAYRTWTTQAGSGFDGTVGSGGLFDLNTGQATRFVQNFALTNASSFRSARLRPGVELVNGNPAVNGGSISVISDLDLGQGTVDPVTGAFTGKFRVAATGEPGVLSLRASNNVVFGNDKSSASISDGFYAFNAFTTPDTTALGAYLSAQKKYETYLADYADYTAAYANYLKYQDTYDQNLSSTGVPGSGAPQAPTPVAQPTPYNPAVKGQTLSLLQQSLDPANWGDSWSYRVIGGANTRGPNPLGVSIRAQVPQQARDTGNVILTGHKLFTYSKVVGSTPATLTTRGSDLYNQYGPTYDLTGNGALPGLQSTDLTISYSAPGTGYTLTANFAQPSLLRTGTGSIAIAAANDIALTDPQKPDPLGSAAIYTGGRPTQTANSGYGASLAFGHSRPGPSFPGTPAPVNGTGASTILTATTNSEGGGDILLKAQRNILGVENAADSAGITSTPGSFLGQFWTPWLLTNPSDPKAPWYVNFGSFAQGVLSLGGNVTVAAGGDVRDLGVSLPTTAYLDAANIHHLTGGGVLSVTAGGNVLSGTYYVGRGSGSIKSGGSVASDFNYVSIDDPSHAYPVATLLAVQDATLSVRARQSVDIGGVYDPTYIYSSATQSSLGQPPVLDYTNVDPQSANNMTQSPVNFVPYVTSLTSASGVSAQAASGDLGFNTLEAQGDLFDFGLQLPSGPGGTPGYAAQISSVLLPSSVSLTALSGGIAIDHGGGLFPSASGSLSIVADRSVTLAVATVPETGGYTARPPAFTAAGNVFGFSLGKLDYPVGTGILPTASNPALLDVSQLEPKLTHDPALAKAGAADPSRIYRLSRSIQDGSILSPGTIAGGVASAGQTIDQISLVPNGPTQIKAGQDILDLPFYGQNFKTTDITSIVAGRDIGFNPNGDQQSPIIELAGPGTLNVQAGRNINFPSQRNPGVTETGIRTIGNAIDTNANAITNPGAVANTVGPYLGQFGNPYLPVHQGASVSVLFGEKPGIDLAAFSSRYIDPASADAASAYLQTLTAFIGQYEQSLGNAAGGNPTAGQAWAIFETLNPNQRQLLVERVVLQILDKTGTDYNKPQSPFYRQYARGYEAINTLFPAGLGYTANNLGGGTNGANQLIATGNLDLRGSTIQTQQGGDISIFGPGGRILVGSSGASPAVNPASEGILTFEKGNIGIFTDQDVLVAQSRIFTEQGGNLVMWTSNGSLDAGRGAKTSVSLPPPLFQCDITFACVKDEKGEVTGAGIATLQSLASFAAGNVDLIAPRGKVDAGAAGIRVSGNLNIAALFVVNAFNIQVQGLTSGIPVVQPPNISALSNASNVTGAAIKEAGVPGNETNNKASIIIVEIIGFGGPSDGDRPIGDCPDGTPKVNGKCVTKPGSPQPQKRVYNSDSPVQIVGSGLLAEDELQYLTAAERANLTRQN